MKQCSIDAEYRGEERYSKLSLAYADADEEKRINSAIEEATNKFPGVEPQIYTSKTVDGRKLIIIEYHDDYDREANQVFEILLKRLDITVCQ